ncbi:MAG TPA: ferritin-like domain-containing protein [Flavobacteriaceae bacterium]|nr:ferritin-like domain-containing protein [Flavobacteriaceae bacterium]
MKKTPPQTNNETYKKLGFTYLETAEIVVALKELIANYTIHYYKLRNFHWNVEGSDFFELHNAFEKEYEMVTENIDILAERILVFGIKPNLSLNEIMEMSEIKETAKDLSPINMVKELLKDYDILHNAMLNVVTAAQNTGDNVTEHIITNFMQVLEKRNWMFTSFIK